jgi:hypothetical protein
MRRRPDFIAIAAISLSNYFNPRLRLRKAEGKKAWTGLFSGQQPVSLIHQVVQNTHCLSIQAIINQIIDKISGFFKN